MEISSAWVGKIVKLDVSSGFYFCGKIVSIVDDDLTMLDKNGNLVQIKTDEIKIIREVR